MIVFFSPGNVTKLISTVQKTFTKKKYKILTPNVSNGKLSAQTVWITKFLWNGTDYVSGIQNVSGALQLTSLSAAIAFPYTNSSFTDSGKEAVRFNFKSTNYSLYANTADCFGVQSSIARYYWNIWKVSAESLCLTYSFNLCSLHRKIANQSSVQNIFHMQSFEIEHKLHLQNFDPSKQTPSYSLPVLFMKNHTW